MLYINKLLIAKNKELMEAIQAAQPAHQLSILVEDIKALKSELQSARDGN